MSFTTLILAAGEGTRMKSRLPKVAHNLLGKPMVRWVTDAASAAGSDAIIAITGHGAERVNELLETSSKLSSPVTIVSQDEQLGTGHAVSCATSELSNLNGSLVILSGDTPLIRPETIESLVEARESTGAAVALLTMEPADPFGYGRIIRDEDGVVTSIVEQKDCTDEQAAIRECNSGTYCFDIKLLLEHLDELSTNNAQGEYYLTDMVQIFNALGAGVTAFMTDDYTETLGVNSRVQLAQVSSFAQERINTAHMLEGVTMLDPKNVWIGPDVKIGRDTEILPLSIIYGESSLGEGCVVGPNTRIVDTKIGNDCVLEETITVEAILDEGVSCGPRAYLRPLTHMKANSKAGTHVEIKKSTIGEGSKVPHLAYIGDTTMGSGTNIGAGVITCNYDGVKKSPTTIGDNVFIGSDTMLVAPVTIEDYAVTAAGSAIAEDVPAKNLAMERSEQMNIPGWIE